MNVSGSARLRSYNGTLAASFVTVADDRLVYNGQLTVSITKAGLFSVQLVIPDGYAVLALREKTEVASAVLSLVIV